MTDDAPHMLAISAFVICLNEGVRIGATLASLKGVVEEIVVVDSGSTDDTVAIAEQYGAKVVHNDWPGYGLQKRFAEDLCQHDWVLNLDADEVLSSPLIQEIRDAWQAANHADHAADSSAVDGYELNIRDCIPGEVRPRQFAHTTRAVRLYNKTKGRYASSPVHDRVQFAQPNPRIITLRAPVYHYSVISMEQVIAKLNRYSSMQAQDMAQRGRTPSLLSLRLFYEFPLAFLKSYILRGDVLRGRSGFVNSMTHAFSRFARVAKVWEKQQ